MNMWKKIRQTGCTLLAAALLFTACVAVKPTSSGPAGGPAMGRFVEKELELPGSPSLEKGILCRGKDGALVVLDLQNALRWDSADGGDTWQEAPLAWLAELEEKPSAADCAPDGTIWAADRKGKLYRVSPEGEVTGVKVAALDQSGGENRFVSAQLTALSAERVYIDYSVFEIQDGSASALGEGAQICDGQGNLIADLGDMYRAAASGDTLYVRDRTKGCQAVDIETGATRETMDGAGLFAEQVLGMAALDGELYFLDSTGLRKIPFGGNLPQVLLEGGAFTFGDPTMSVEGLQVLSGECIVMLLQSSSGRALYRYKFDSTVPSQAAATLRVWSLEDHEMLRLAVRQYHREHPEVDVNLEIALPEGTGQTAEDAIRALNTELLNGQGPDVLMLDGLPAESLAKNGMLADLSGLVDPEAFEPVFVEPFRTEGKLCMVPAQFALPLLAGSSALLDQAQDLEQLAALMAAGPAPWQVGPNGEGLFEKHPAEQRPVLYFDTLRSAFDLMWAASAPAVLAEDGAADDAAFRRFAGAMATIDGRYGLAAKGDQASSGAWGASVGNITYTLGSEMFSYITGGAQLGCMLLENTFAATYAVKGGPEGPGEARPFPGLEGSAYVPQVLAGVNSAGSHQEEAGAFVQTLLGSEVQNTLLETGMPTTRAGFAAQRAALAEMLNSVDLKENLYDPTTLVKQLTGPMLAPSAVTEAAFEAVKALCEGSVDLDGAAAQFEQAVGLYLAEQR